VRPGRRGSWVIRVVGAAGEDKATGSAGGLDALGPVLYPGDRRGSRAAPGCPLFGEDTVLERTDTAEGVLVKARVPASLADARNTPR